MSEFNDLWKLQKYYEFMNYVNDGNIDSWRLKLLKVLSVKSEI